MVNWVSSQWYGGTRSLRDLFRGRREWCIRGRLSGPWLALWLRRRPGAGPEPRAVALPLLAVGAAPVVGFASWSGLAITAVVVAVLGPLGGWAYARALRWGLWVLRLGYPVAAVVAATQLSLAGATLLVLYAAVVVLLAWSPEASRAQRPISARLPAPRPRRRTQ